MCMYHGIIRRYIPVILTGCLPVKSYDVGGGGDSDGKYLYALISRAQFPATIFGFSLSPYYNDCYDDATITIITPYNT